MLHFTYPETSAPKLLKQVLKEQGVSLTLWRKIKRCGSISVNGKIHPVWIPIQGGDTIAVSWPENKNLEPVKMPLSIIYEDEFLLAVNKPAGIPVHPTQYHPINTLANAVIYYYNQINLPIGFHPVHRLDRNTSGLLLIAKSPIMQHLLSQHTQKLFKKIYLAIVAGTFSVAEGIIQAPIARSPDSIIKRMVSDSGQTAVTHFTLLRTFKKYSLLKIQLQTGRTHQIRVHMAHIHHPLLGDDLYGGSTELITRQALHAAELIFYHPLLNKNIHLTCPVPKDFKNLLNHNC